MPFAKTVLQIFLMSHILQRILSSTFTDWQVETNADKPYPLIPPPR